MDYDIGAFVSDQPADAPPPIDQPKATALVILPFMSTEAAEQFAVLVMAQFGEDFQTPLVTTGTAYNYRSEETGEYGQVFELYPDAHWEAFVGEDSEQHHIIRRVTQQGGTDAVSIGRSVDHDGPGQGAGEGGGVPA